MIFDSTDRAGELNRREKRNGVAFLLLVVVVMLVVLGATKSLVTNEITHRRSEIDQFRVRIMSNAIEAVRQVDELAEPLQLPIGSESTEYIEVQLDPSRTFLLAQWHRGDRVIDEMKQRIQSQQEPTELESNE